MSAIDFDGINKAALGDAKSLLTDLIPGGAFRGPEYIVRNPRRNDKNPGSFSINYSTGIWIRALGDERDRDAGHREQRAPAPVTGAV